MDPKDFKGSMSRRDFLGLTAASLASAAFSPYSGFLPKPEDLNEQEIEFENNGSDELTCLGAVLSTIEHSSQESDYVKKYPRSLQFVEGYYDNLGFKLSEYRRDIPMFSPNILDDMPSNDTRMQVEYLKRLNTSLGGDLIANVDLEDIFNNPEIWKDIPPGAVMYMPNENYGQSYSYISIFLGIQKDGSPLFAGSITRPECDISLKELSSIYKGKYRDGLKVTLFDSVEASRRYGFESGRIVPNHELLKTIGFDIVTTVNINDGTLSLWDISAKSPQLIKVDGKEEIYCAVGRRLKRNDTLSSNYWKSKYRIENSFYDGISGTFYDGNGVRRTTYTPPLIAEYLGHSVIQGFGGLGPDSYTDIALLKPLHWDIKEKKLVLGSYSSYTLHEIPITNDPGVLGRLPMLIEANKKGKALENPNLSAGCVNMTRDSFKEYVEVLRKLKNEGKRISVIFLPKGINQEFLVTPGQENMSFHSNDPFGGKSKYWEYGQAINSNSERRKYLLFSDR